MLTRLRVVWARWRARWAYYRTLRRWRALPPEAQLGVFIQCLDTTPSLRRAMRKALRVSGDAERPTGRRRRA